MNTNIKSKTLSLTPNGEVIVKEYNSNPNEQSTVLKKEEPKKTSKDKVVKKYCYTYNQPTTLNISLDPRYLNSHLNIR